MSSTWVSMVIPLENIGNVHNRVIGKWTMFSKPEYLAQSNWGSTYVVAVVTNSRALKGQEFCKVQEVAKCWDMHGHY